MSGGDHTRTRRGQAKELTAGTRSERERDLRRGRLYTAGALFLCVAAIAACVGGVFTVWSVRVEGAPVPAATLLQSAGVQGQNIFMVQSDEVVSRLTQLPGVEISSVETSFPDAITVHASLRQAAAGWEHGGVLALLDAAGRQIGTTKTTALPVVSGGSSPPGPGIIAAMRYAVKVLPAAPSGAIASFELSAGTGLTITGRTGWKAICGRGARQVMAERVATLVALLQKLVTSPQRLGTVDLRYRFPYFRPAKP